jgi:polysaccharide biosynthesis protein PelA
MIAFCASLARAEVVSNSVIQPSFAFFYGRDIPWESLGAFDIAVVEPGNVTPLPTGPGWSHRLNPATQVAAYIAIGEVHPTRAYFKKMRPEWTLGENKDWNSIVVDQAAPGWREFYLKEVIAPLWQQGYRAFFLDTLDSFHLVAKTPEVKAAQVDGMVQLVRSIKSTYPEVKLIFNRGFEILPQVHKEAYAVVAESLFQGWDAGKQSYREVPQADRDWLWGQLKKCKDQYGLPVVSIDYVPPENRALARETAQKIKALGAVPWVTNPALDMLGVGQVEVIPRQILALHDEPGHLGDVALHEIHRMATMPLNYLGLDVRYVYVESEEFRQMNAQPLAGRYAGVLTWFNRGTFPQTAQMLKTMQAARGQDVPLVIVGAMPDAALLDPLGITAGTPERVNVALKLEKLSPHVGFEIEPKPIVSALTPLLVRGGTPWLRVTAPSGRYADAIAITPWGGYAVERYWKVDLSQNQGARWAVNPIEFFRAALRIDSKVPVPDVTTETGRRLQLVHVDGDGFANRAEIPGTPLASEVMLSEFLQRYKFPSTISIIEGEVAASGLYAALTPQLEATARKIFELPYVEIATHTYSHPFHWADLELGRDPAGRTLTLRVPNYRYNVEREIQGSAHYINTRLAPAGKKAKMLLWSGNSQPLGEPVRVAYQNGLLNMNAGDTWITKAEPSLTIVGPLGMLKGDYFQVYAPNQNENVYTNGWTGPFYGFERVIETFEMTELPLRLKPVNIYYHTYNASKRASIVALHKVYQWAQAHNLHPVYASEYAQRVLDWRRATVARSGPLSQDFELRGGEHLRQWRVDASDATPDLALSRGLAGYAQHAGSRYLHATNSIAFYATFLKAGSVNDVKTAYVVSANSKLTQWVVTGGLPGTSSTQTTSNTATRAMPTTGAAASTVENSSTGLGLRRVSATFDGHVPLKASLHAPGCELNRTASSPHVRAQRATAGDPGILDIEGSILGQTQLVLRCTE